MPNKLKKLLLSEVLIDAKLTQRIAYIAVMSALAVVCNMFEIKVSADMQFSLTIFISAMTGIIIGPLFGFTAAFIGDLVGFLVNSGGFPYMPWIGLAMGAVALIAGLVMNGLNFKFKGAIFLKLAIVCILTLALCTIGINTTAFWVLYSKGVPYFAYVSTRLFVQGQIWNSLFNYGLLLVAYPTFDRVKAIIIKNINVKKAALAEETSEQADGENHTLEDKAEN